MTARTTSLRRTIPSPVLALGALALLVAGCNSSKSAEQREVPAGTYDQKENGEFFFVDPTFGGAAAEFRVARQFFGRLVDIVAFEDATLTERVTIHRDFVIDPRAESNWPLPDYELETNPVTGAQSLVIYRNFADTTANGGREQFRQLLASAAAGVRPVVDTGFESAGTYTMVPRNAAFVLVFDDLIDERTINQISVGVRVGRPTIIPFEARVIADPNFGDLADYDGQPGLEFYSSRIIVDPAISEVESFQTNPPLNVNTVGFPASQDVNFSNVEVRIPTQAVAGQQLPILQNPTAHALAFMSNGSADGASATRDLVRAFRSGGNTEVTADPSNGFLPDETPPTLIGSLSAAITLPPEDPPNIDDPLVFNIPRIQFSSTTCAQSPEPGDLVSQGALFAEVLNSTTVSPGGLAEDVLVRLIAFPSNFTGPEQFLTTVGPIQYLVPYVEAEDASRAQCFVRVSPAVPDPNFPTAAISPGSTFALRFSEAIDPDRFEPYESFRLLRSAPPADPNALISPTEYVPGQARNTSSLQEFRFEPALGLSHAQGVGESYFLDFPDGPRAPRDLAGNTITALLPTLTFTIDPTAPDTSTGGRVTRFESPDEEPPFADPTDPENVLATLSKPEWFGQINFDLQNGRIRPRPVVRSQVVCSGSNELPAAMVVGPGTTLPLSPFGARTQILWRYIDFGESLPLNRDNDISKDLNFQELNLDVEGVSLSPSGGNPVFESFPDFQMSMSHSAWLPDEVINPLSGALVAPQSGIQGTFDGNLLDGLNDQPQIVHPRGIGYTVNPGDQSLANDGTPLIPLPMNQNTPESQKLFYTWRDTSLQARGGPSGFGAPPGRVGQITGQAPTSELITMMGPDCTQPGLANPFYLPEEIRTAALPLLIDLRCYPTGGSASSNVFTHQLAHPTTLPGFRAYSAGGRNQAGSLIIVDPDSETIANGGFDPTSMPPGAALPGVDNALYFGALDLVVRVSRVHSIFFEALDPIGVGPFSAPTHADPVVFPEIQPQGTRVDFDFRGAVTVIPLAEEDASRTDAYGDFYETKPINYTPGTMDDPLVEFRGNASCFDGSFSYQLADENGMTGFLNNDNRWKRDVAELTGARFFQARITFVSNVATGLTPEIAAVGFSWQE